MKKLIFILTLVITTGLSQGQLPSELLQGLTALEKGDTKTAESNFSKWAVKKGPYQTAAIYLWAKTFYREGKYDESFAKCMSIISDSPTSSYFDDALYLSGKCAFKKKEYAKATRYWINVLKFSKDDQLRKSSSKNVADALDHLLTPQEIKTLQNQMDGPVAQAILTIRVAKNEIAAEQYAYAKQILERYVIKYPDGQYTKIAKDMLNDIYSKYSGGSKIALLLPLTGYNEEIGIALNKGLQFANIETGNQIQLDVYDQNQSMHKILNTVELIGNDPGVLGLVGPIDNETSAAVGMLSKYIDFPVISPTAGEVGIANTTEFIYQLSPDYEIIASKLANYALHTLENKTFAILAPLDIKGIQLAAAFKKTVEEGGGQVLFEEWYYPDSDSYKEQFMRIRRKVIYTLERDTVLMEYPEYTDAEVDSFLKAEQELFYEENPDAKIDSLEIKIEMIDGFFIPIYESDLRKMAAQFAFYNFNTTLLGNDGWLDRDFMVKNQVYFKEALFCTGYYLDEESWDFKNFKNRFRKEMKSTPEFYEVLGYDFGKFILDAAKNAENRTDFLNKIAHKGPYRGLSVGIQFGEKPRVNSQVKMIKFKMGQFLNVE